MEILKRGSKGEEVRLWQEFLQSLGHDATPDGDFGQKTHVATRNFQLRFMDPEDADGIVGPRTIAKAKEKGFAGFSASIEEPKNATANIPKYRLAKSLEVLRSQLDATYPNRSRKSDGWIGDTSHASRTSDHNPHVRDGATGVVTAIDITHDPANGLHARELAETLIASRDPRIKYIISEGQICSSKQQPWIWRKYTGSNGHFHHVHISVMPDKAKYDDSREWRVSQ